MKINDLNQVTLRSTSIAPMEAVSGNNSMVVHNMRISHSIGWVDSIPWMTWNIVKPMAFLGDGR
jgi:hypothetical protein